jgi:hypothetical protein
MRPAGVAVDLLCCPRFAEDRNFSNAGFYEVRKDPADGHAYTFQDFVEHYGTNAPSAWATANMIPPAQWFLYHAPRNAIGMTNLHNAPQCRQQKKSKSERCRQVVMSSFRNPGSPLIVFAPPNL